MVLCDMLWFFMNQAVHNGIIQDAIKLAANMKRVSLDHYATWSSLSHPTREHWIPPTAGHYKINFASVSKDHFSTEAIVCRDSKGKIIKTISQISPSASCDSIV